MKKIKQIPKDTEILIEAVVEKAVRMFYSKTKINNQQEIRDYYKSTEKRLYSYPELISNIEKYEQDIQDLKHEATLPGNQKSKDIVKMKMSAGCRLSADEILEGRIQVVENKRIRDQKEIDEVKYALGSIDNDPHYMIIEHKYFCSMTDSEIAEKNNCDERTVRRHKNRLLQKIMIRFYGADAMN